MLTPLASPCPQMAPIVLRQCCCHRLSETISGQSTDLLELCSQLFRVLFSIQWHRVVCRWWQSCKRLRLAETTRRTKIDSQTIRVVPEMTAEWEETVKKCIEQAESQNDNLAGDKELCPLKQSAEAGIKTRLKEYAATLQKMTPEQENSYQSMKWTSAKAQFRQDWATEQYALAKKSWVEKQSCRC